MSCPLVLEPVETIGCEPFHGDACEGEHCDLGDMPPLVLMAMVRDAYPDKLRQRGLLRRLMADHGMLPARPLHRTAVDRLRDQALDDPGFGDELAASRAELDDWSRSGHLEAAA